MSQSKLESFHQKLDRTKKVCLIGPMPCNLVDLDLSCQAVLAVDGGVLQLPREHIDLSIGDGDSSQQMMDLNFPTNKDMSDLALALDLLPSKRLHIELCGFWAGRLDHNLMNLGEVFRALKMNDYTFKIHSPDSSEILWGLQVGGHELELKGLFSLFSFNPSRVSIEGQCQYPLKPQMIHPLSTQLLSNMATGKVVIQSTEPFFCYHKAQL